MAHPEPAVPESTAVVTAPSSAAPAQPVAASTTPDGTASPVGTAMAPGAAATAPALSATTRPKEDHASTLDGITKPMVAATSSTATPRTYRYELGPGDDLASPVADLRRRVEMELKDGRSITVSIHIVRPAGGQAQAPPATERSTEASKVPAPTPAVPSGAGGNGGPGPTRVADAGLAATMPATSDFTQMQPHHLGGDSPVNGQAAARLGGASPPNGGGGTESPTGAGAGDAGGGGAGGALSQRAGGPGAAPAAANGFPPPSAQQRTNGLMGMPMGMQPAGGMSGLQPGGGSMGQGGQLGQTQTPSDLQWSGMQRQQQPGHLEKTMMMPGQQGPGQIPFGFAGGAAQFPGMNATGPCHGQFTGVTGTGPGATQGMQASGLPPPPPPLGMQHQQLNAGVTLPPMQAFAQTFR